MRTGNFACFWNVCLACVCVVWERCVLCVCCFGGMSVSRFVRQTPLPELLRLKSMNTGVHHNADELVSGAGGFFVFGVCWFV